jgi:hypothetical protein
MIYFVRSPRGGPIKIGTTIRLADRLPALNRGRFGPVEVLAIMDGGYDEEAALHRKFRYWRCEDSFSEGDTEWFTPCDKLLALIETEGRPWTEIDDDGAFVTVKIGRPEHARLKLVAGVQGRDISDLLTDLVRGPLERLYKQALAKLNAEEGN